MFEAAVACSCTVCIHAYSGISNGDRLYEGAPRRTDLGTEFAQFVTEYQSRWSLYDILYRLNPLVRGPPGPMTGGSNIYKTRKAMWPYLDHIILDHIRIFLSIIIV